MPATDKAVTDKFISAGIAKIDRMIGSLARKFFMIKVPVENNKIMFMTYRNDYDCNPKYIAERILEEGLPYDLVWAVPGKGSMKKGNFPSEIRRVRRGSFEFYQELASAHIWVDNSLNCVWTPVPKKKEQVYIETWHGSMGLKRVGNNDVKNKRWLKAAKRATSRVDYCISDSMFENQVYRETHWPTAEILEYGHPRNDILVDLDEEKRRLLKERVAEMLEFDLEAKVLLYAPTFRDSGTLECYDIDFERLFDALKKRFGGDWVVLYRLHFHDRNKLPDLDESLPMIDATGYLDMQELLAIADAGITDYSSWCCDYVLTGRPCFIYARDLESYNTERGLYYPLEETPFPIATDNEELEQAILSFDEERYLEDRDEFLRARGCWEDGHAAEKVVEKIKEIIGE